MPEAITDSKLAVIYVRVSTKEQAERGDDPEGYSIPAQRAACRRRADALRAEVVEEYIDRGESAKTADRPELQRMLERLKGHDIDYVIVHKVDRLARNRVDDVTIGLALRAAGVQLVSVTENIDDTPSGKLLHGIMASIAEFYSQNLATEILKGSVQKAKAGGTPHYAPIGYLNVRHTIDGREVRTIALDPERAPLVAWAFEAYATGEWSLRDLLDELTDRGLTNRAGGNRPERRLHLSKFNQMLRAHYFFCLGRHTRRTGCTMPYLQLEDVEAALVRYWRQHVQLAPELVEQVRGRLLADLQHEQAQAGRVMQQVKSRIAKIENMRRMWAEKVANGSVPDDIGREKQNELTRQLIHARHELSQLEAASTDIEATLNEALDLVRDCATAYEEADPALRREWNQTFFERIEVHVDEVTSATLRPPFDTLLDPQVIGLYQRAKSTRPPQKRHTAPLVVGSRSGESDKPAFVGAGLSKSLLVELMGLEPTTPCLQSRCSSN